MASDRVWLARRTPAGGLDWLNLFVANIQTGFGPFIAVFLTTQGWTQTLIGNRTSRFLPSSSRKPSARYSPSGMAAMR